MSIIDKLYNINNKTVRKTINIDDSLYAELIELITNKYDATISDIVNICLEEYIETNQPKYYEKPAMESVTYRSIMIRQNNLNHLKLMHKETGISITRLLNSSIKEFIQKNKN